MDWAEAGRGWGAHAVEWAYLVEPYARPANELLFDRLGVGDKVRLLDIACGSGFAAQLSSRRGAAVTGLDAAGALVKIARARTPRGDFRVGDMFSLPFADELSPPDHGAASMEQGATGRPGVVEDMLATTGFALVERGSVNVVNEWPDPATAVRALAASGPSVPAIEAVGYDAFCEALNEVIAPLYDRDLGVRVISEFGWVTAKAN